MVKLGTSVEFDSDQCKITQNSKLLAIDEMQGKLYILKIIPDEQVNIAREDSSVQLWYCHFCHLGIDNVTKLIKGKMVEGMNCITNGGRNSVCKACIMGKQHHIAYPKRVSTCATKAFEIVHSDVCGPMSVNSVGGSQYFAAFIHDYLRYTYVHFIKYKHEVLVKFKEFNFATNLTGKQVKFCVLTMVVNIAQSDLMHT